MLPMLTRKQFIQQLKQQPRHGYGLGDLMNDLKDWGDIGSEVGGAITGIATAINHLNDANSNVVRGLERTLAINDELIKQYIAAAKGSLYLERRNKILNQSFGIVSSTAADLASNLQKASIEYKATGEQMMQYAAGIRKLIPGMNQTILQDNKRYKGLVRVQQVLTTNLGLSEDQANEYAAFAVQRGKDATDQLLSQYALSEEIERSTGEIGVFKTITEGIAATSADLQLQYGRIPGNLELAVLKANKLGFSMKDLAGAASNLLNIESSIGEELEYQLLSGRRLVGSDKARADLQGKSLTNAYREATLRGDANKQADIMNTILEQEGETLQNNLFARQQMSKLLGMDEAALSRALQKKSLLQELGGEELFELTGDALLQAAQGLGATQEQLDKLQEATDTRTTDDILKQIYTVLSEGRGAIANELTNQRRRVEGTKKQAMDDVMDPSVNKFLLNPERVGSLAKAGGASLAGAALEAKANLINTKLLTVEKATIQTATTNTTPASDLVSMPGTSDRVLTGPFGAFSLDDRDMIMAGDPKKMTGASSTADSNFMAAAAMIVAAINSQTAQLKRESTFGAGLTGQYYA
jgi:hypothetical protein